ncbi:MAG TPA: cell division protein FtsL [Nitrospirales bacterium]|jgi:cell division protein FtsL|nr:cell division protein FtsL [Nitrospirales bacterium]
MKFLVGAVLWVLALVAVWEKVDIVRTGYAIERLQERKKQVQQEQQFLRLEMAKLTSPEQIERTAVAQLGMVRPKYDQVVLVKGVSPSSPDASAGRIVPAAHIR